MTRIKTDCWITSQNDKMFNGEEYDTKEKAIEGGKKEYGGESFYVGRTNTVLFDASDIDISDNIYEELGKQLYDEVGEAAESWEVENELLHQLDKKIGRVVVEWIEENELQPTCFSVSDVFCVRMEGRIMNEYPSKICDYCLCTRFGSEPVNTGPYNLCEDAYCDEAFAGYKEDGGEAESIEDVF